MICPECENYMDSMGSGDEKCAGCGYTYFINWNPELRCKECQWEGDWADVSYGRNCPHCWNDYVTVLADENR